jgi:ubiquinone/menaquinone biosynthesis C-methylase UbiE
MEQQKIWDNIAPEWFKFKKEPAWHVQEFLKDKTGRVLDLGSGSGRHLQKIKNGKMYLVDFSKKMIKLAKKKSKKEKIPAEVFVASLDKLPFEDNFFDSAIAVASIHCLTPEKQKKAIKELYRVLKPKAQAEITVWNKNSRPFKNAGKEKYIAWHDKGKRYYYLFDEKEIHKLFKDFNFKIVSHQEPKRNIIFVVQKPTSS